MLILHTPILTAVSKSDLRIEEKSFRFSGRFNFKNWLLGRLGQETTSGDPLCLFADCLILQNMLFVFIIVESCYWGCSVQGVLLEVSRNLQRRRLWWGFFLNKSLRRDSGPGVFFMDFVGFLGAPAL